MSADEIRRLASDALSNGIKIRDELLKHAAMVERCEKMKFNMIPHRHDTEIVDHILKGTTDERK